MMWDAHQLKRELQQLTTSIQSPFTIPLPADRIIILTASKRDAHLTCATIRIKQGVVRFAQIGGINQSLIFNQGIDLKPVAEMLAPCDQWRIALMANWSFLKGEMTINYAETAVTGIGMPRLWD